MPVAKQHLDHKIIMGLSEDIDDVESLMGWHEVATIDECRTQTGSTVMASRNKTRSKAARISAEMASRNKTRSKALWIKAAIVRGSA